MNLAVVGSRQGVYLDAVRMYVEAVHEKHPTLTLISGGAHGVDRVAEYTAFRLGHHVISLRPVEIHPGLFRIERWEGEGADSPFTRIWSARYGDFASFAEAAKARNILIVFEADVVVAFTAGTRGTAHTISEARRLKRKIFLYDSQGGRMEVAA